MIDLKYKNYRFNHTNLLGHMRMHSLIAITTLGITGLSKECYGVLAALLSSFHCNGSL